VVYEVQPPDRRVRHTGLGTQVRSYTACYTVVLREVGMRLGLREQLGVDAARDIELLGRTVSSESESSYSDEARKVYCGLSWTSRSNPAEMSRVRPRRQSFWSFHWN
jgi:hypothetical protein